MLVPKLSELLGLEVNMANDCIGMEVQRLVDEQPKGGVVLLENLRFHEEEKNNDLSFAQQLTSLGDIYVNDAFGSSHKSHASIVRVSRLLKPSVAGFHMQEELKYLLREVANPKRPFVVILGGSKVSSKIGVIDSLLEKVDMIFFGGGLIFTFYKFQGNSVGESVVEDGKVELAKALLEKVPSKILLPTDVVVADKLALGSNNKVVSAADIPDGWMGLDIGLDSIKSLSEALDSAKRVIWTWPMGVFKHEEFAGGTKAIAKKLADLSENGEVTSIVGGGETVAVVNKLNLVHKFSHISTGGGATAYS